MAVKKFRMDLHQIPEVGFCEFETKQYIMSVLKPLDCKIFEIGNTGVVAFFDFGKQKTKRDCRRALSVGKYDQNLDPNPLR